MVLGSIIRACFSGSNSAHILHTLGAVQVRVCEFMTVCTFTTCVESFSSPDIGTR